MTEYIGLTMLCELHIRNLAVVDDVNLSFEKGLNVLTGSTGAGKSLILSAVNFLLGERSNTQAIRAGEEKAAVEGVFAPERPVQDGLLSGGTVGERLRLRREVHRNGRSQAFINGKPCTVRQLQDVSRRLIEPHGQNEQFRLKFAESHVVYLDTFAANESLVEEYRGVLDSFKDTAKELREFDSRIALLKDKKELFEHRLEELERVGIAPGEKTAVEESIRVLEHANDVFETLAEAENVIYEDENSAVSLISRARTAIGRLAGLDRKIEGFAGDLESAEIALKETVGEMRAYLERLEFEPGELERKQERLAFLSDLERRYQMPIDEIIVESERWREKLGSIEFEDEERSTLQKKKSGSLARLRKAAVELGESRRKAAGVLDKKMTRELGHLMMAGARFRTDVSYETDASSDLVVDKRRVRIGPEGIDRVEFYVQTNPGEDEGALADVASSGELSRIALALKEVVSTGREGSLLIFDELDAGVGADLGEMIARKLHAIARNYQIICITHMAQIAAKADSHLVVSKRTSEGRTFAEVSVVEGDPRLAEIARMLGGREGSEKRLALAHEMLQRKKSIISPEVRP